MANYLNKLENTVYRYLIDYTAQNTYQPSIREIAKQFDIKSTKTVSDILQSLSNKGFIERHPTRSRGVKLLGFSPAHGASPVPYYNSANTGNAALGPDTRTGFINLDRRLITSERTFILEVTDNSVVSKGILPGDFTIADQEKEAKNGDVVICRLGDRIIIRELRFENGTTTLVSDSVSEPALVVRISSDFKILGVVTGSFRTSVAISEEVEVSPSYSAELPSPQLPCVPALSVHE